MTIKTTNKSPEVREFAIRMVFDQKRDHPVTVGSGGVDRGEDLRRAADAARGVDER